MSKITESARGQECQIRLPGVCSGNNETVVWCHANGLASGRGSGLKSHDLTGAYGCNKCHDVYDRRVKTDLPFEFVQVCFMEGHMRSLQILIEKGLVKA